MLETTARIALLEWQTQVTQYMSVSVIYCKAPLCRNIY